MDKIIMQTFLKENVKLIPEHKLKPLYVETIRNKFHKEHGLYLNYNKLVSKAKWEQEDVRFQSNADTYEELVADYNNFVKADNNSEEERNEKLRFSSLFSSYHLRLIHEGKNFVDFTLGDYGMNIFFDLLWYLDSGAIAENLEEANDLMKKNDMNYNTVFDRKTIEGFNTFAFDMKIFFNGKIRIWNLPDSVVDNIKRIRELVA